jgi:hypothetical protein
MAPVKFRIHYVKGKENARVDALSRRLNYAEGIESKEQVIFKKQSDTLVYAKS